MTKPSPGAWMSCDYREPGSWAAGYHTGRDWANTYGSPVVATRAGKVVGTGWAGDYGIQVVVESDRIRHYYNHLDTYVVGTGDHVEQGQRLGSVGTTGNSTGPHVHYEERVAPYGYHDHREPQWDDDDEPDPPPAEPEQLLEGVIDMAANTVVLFQYEGGWYEADLIAGVYRGFGTEADFNDRQYVLRKMGVPFAIWDEGSVGNPRAFGLQVA